MTRAKRDDGTEIEVEYEILQHGYPSNGWDDAGEGTIVSITEAYDDDGKDVDLPDDERERMEQAVAISIDEDPHYYDEGPDA